MRDLQLRQPRPTASNTPRTPSWATRPGLRTPWAAACLTCLIAAPIIFVLPLFVPMKPEATISTAYLAGFNNTLATLAGVAISLGVLLVTLYKHRNCPSALHLSSAQLGLTRSFVIAVVLASSAVLAVSGMLVRASHLRYLGDAGYIIEQASVYHDTGRALYTQIEFAYGPLLLLPVVWLSRLLHGATTAAYFILLVLYAAFGLLLLAFVLNELPIRTSLRRAAFVLFAVGAITPHLGLNYTLLRFVSPFAILLFATRTRSRWRCAVLLAVGEALELLISPELGLAMSVGVLTYSLLRVKSEGLRWLAAGILPLLTLMALLLTFGRPYLRMTASFSRGTLNLPLGPYPHTIVLLFALIWLVPFGLGQMVNSREQASARLLAVYAVGLAFMPAALGRCDPLHVFFNGLGILILSLMVVSLSSRPWRIAWVLCLTVLVGWNQFVNQQLFAYRTGDVWRRTALPYLPPPLQRASYDLAYFANPLVARGLFDRLGPEYHVDQLQLDRIVGPGTPIFTPLEIRPALETDLKASHHYSPGFFAFWVDMLNSGTERRSIDEANRHSWMLLPPELAGQDFSVYMPSQTYLFQGLNLGYRQRNPIPYHPGYAFLFNLSRHWTAVAHFGPYTLYKNNDVQRDHENGFPNL